MEEQQKNPSSYIGPAIIIGGVLVIAGVFLFSQQTPPSPETTQEQTSAVSFAPAAIRGSGRYPDGVYSAVGMYAPHGQPHDFQVTVTLVNDVITDVESKLITEHPISEKIVANEFEPNYKALVVGKPIEGLALDRVAGSSLTPLGFNDALRQIEEYAATL